MNFHPVPHDVTVSCGRYTMGFPVCYGSPSDVFAASSDFVHLYTLRFKEKRERERERWWRQTHLYTSRAEYSGSSVLEDLNFRSVNGLLLLFSILSDDRSKASSKTIPPHSAIQSLVFQIPSCP